MTTKQLQKEIFVFVSLYKNSILPCKNRRVQLLGRKCSPELMRTFVGYELRLGRKRVTCPDMSTARYLRIFAELGVKSISIPYDPTQTANILPDLERSFGRIKDLIGMDSRSDRSEGLRRTYRLIRLKLARLEENTTSGAI